MFVTTRADVPLIISVDGSSTSLHKMNITPELIIGDLDSYQESHFPLTPKIYLPDQNQCDFTKTLAYLEGKNLLPSIITGVNGGFLDQILKNISIFSQECSILYDEEQCAFLIHAEECKTTTINLSFSKNTKISLIGAPEATISSEGLKWELNQYELSFFRQNSTSNETIKTPAKLNIHHGKAMIFIYQPIFKHGGVDF
jgi:thiamine pyrophosphokinase